MITFLNSSHGRKIPCLDNRSPCPKPGATHLRHAVQVSSRLVERRSDWIARTDSSSHTSLRRVPRSCEVKTLGGFSSSKRWSVRESFAQTQHARVDDAETEHLNLALPSRQPSYSRLSPRGQDVRTVPSVCAEELLTCSYYLGSKIDNCRCREQDQAEIDLQSCPLLRRYQDDMRQIPK